MDSHVATQIVILAVLLILSAFFSSSETAMLTSNKTKMKLAAEGGDKAAARVIKLCDNQDRMISAILIGNNIVNLYASSLATEIAMAIWGNKAVALATGVLTLLVLVFGEVTPKAISTRYADKMARIIAGPLDILATVLTPFIWLVNFFAGLIMKLFGMDPDKEKDVITEEELKLIVEDSSEAGVIEDDEKEMITNVVEFGDTLAKDVMTPRIDLSMVEDNASYDELIETYREDRYTRIPVYHESPDDVIGIINMKDMILVEKSDDFKITDHMRPVVYTYEFKNTRDLMKELKSSYENAAIVLDEYGVVAGMVTMEDMLEEIVGEIRDEFDTDETENIVKVSEKEYIVDGATKPEELNEAFNLELDEEKNESLSGVIMDILEHVPRVGDEIVTDKCRMVVKSMDKKRIDKVRLYIS